MRITLDGESTSTSNDTTTTTGHITFTLFDRNILILLCMLVVFLALVSLVGLVLARMMQTPPQMVKYWDNRLLEAFRTNLATQEWRWLWGKRCCEWILAFLANLGLAIDRMWLLPWCCNAHKIYIYLFQALRYFFVTGTSLYFFVQLRLGDTKAVQCHQILIFFPFKKRGKG